MSQEITPLEQPDLVPINNFGSYLLRTDFALQWQDKCFEIGSGYEYEMLSIPRYLLTVNDMRIDGVHRAACLIHDFCYQKADNNFISRAEADFNLRAMMLASGLGRTRANYIFEYVSKFGWIYWQKLHVQYTGLHPHKTSYTELSAFAKHFDSKLNESK